MNAFQAIILVCLATIPPDRCTEDTALSVMSKRVANELACASGWQDVIARSADAGEVGKDVYVRTVCRRLPAGLSTLSPEEP